MAPMNEISGSATVYDPMNTLSKLKQNGSLDNYKTLSYFLGGLKDNIQLPIRMFNPKTLNAYSLARI